jgi:hypothetical protein
LIYTAKENCELRYCELRNIEKIAARTTVPDSAIPQIAIFILVDPAGLKPALHGLKGRCSVTRAPDQYYWSLLI